MSKFGPVGEVTTTTTTRSVQMPSEGISGSLLRRSKSSTSALPGNSLRSASRRTWRVISRITSGGGGGGLGRPGRQSPSHGQGHMPKGGGGGESTRGRPPNTHKDRNPSWQISAKCDPCWPRVGHLGLPQFGQTGRSLAKLGQNGAKVDNQDRPNVGTKMVPASLYDRSGAIIPLIRLVLTNPSSSNTPQAWSNATKIWSNAINCRAKQDHVSSSAS